MVKFLILLIIPFVLGVEQHYQPERILDVRQVIKDALDMMRNYPAPTQLIQAQAPQVSQQAQTQHPTTAFYAQQHQSFYPPRQYASRTYNGGVESQVDRKFGARADSQIDYASQMSRWFAQPSQDDMKKLFHLPADILHRLAADAGYIQPSEESNTPEPSNYKSSGSDQSFNFNIEGHGGSPQDLNSFITSLKNPQTPTTTQAPIVDVPGPPKITTRQILKDGKYVSIPILIVPQKNGENIYVPFSDMQQLSEAVNKIISTGHYQFTTPKNPDDDKPFPMPGPMIEETPEDHVQVEPPMQSTSQKSIKNTEVKTKTDGSFVQSFGEEKENEEKSDEEEIEKEVEVTTPKVKKPTTSTIPTTKMTISPKPKQSESKKSRGKKGKQDEIVLNGHRYKLVAVEEPSAEISAETSTPASDSSEQERKPAIVQKTTESKILLTETNDQLLPMNFNLTEQRQYSLKELEELYNKENALATRGDGLDEADSVVIQRQRIMELREKFARDRLELAKQTKETFYKIKPEESQKTNESGDQKCIFLKAFARKYGMSDVATFAKNNCAVIQEVMPSLKCEDLSTFIDQCKTKFMMF